MIYPKTQTNIILYHLLQKSFFFWGDERSCDKGHWHAHTRGLPWGLPEVVGMVQQVHCSRRRLLQRGLEFHVCTINKSAHTKKVWKLMVCPSYYNVCHCSVCYLLHHGDSPSHSWGRTDGVMPFARILTWNKMKTNLSRIWT